MISAARQGVEGRAGGHRRAQPEEAGAASGTPEGPARISGRRL
jgi:hypothetical protein